MKIIHYSDVHIRNLKFHDSYRKAFDNFYKLLDEIKPDLIINTGDVAHTKVQISPEFVELCSDHFRRVSDYAPVHIILGNHDLNLVNLDRQDAITPIIKNIGKSSKHPIVLHKKSGICNLIADGNKVALYIFSCADQKNYPDLSYLDEDSINIGLYHGAIGSAVTDTNWELDSDEDISMFDGLDYTFLGDIHQHQFLDQDGRIAYAGSLIQQNFGENPDKGFLLWEIYNKDEWDVDHIKLKGSRRFFTINLGEDFSIPEQDIEPDSRVRITTERQFTLAEQQRFEKLVKERYKTTDVITIPPQNIGKQNAGSISGKKFKIGNLRDTNVQENLIKLFLADRKLSDEVMSKIFELNRKFQVLAEKDEEVIRDVFWKIKTLGWSNMFNYGENNIIDFSKIKGISGVFAPNSAGKSSLIDVMLESLYDKTTTGLTKNIHLINDNKKIAKMIVEIATGEDSFSIERTIEKIKYGKKKFEEEKEWGKTSTEFKSINEDGSELESLNGQLRSETESNIRRHLGTYDDFIMTSLLAQSRDADIIKCKETDRKKILYKFMDLDVFDQKFKLAKEDSRPHFQRLKDFDSGDLESIFKNEDIAYRLLKHELEEFKVRKANNKLEIEKANQEISILRDKKQYVGESSDIETIKKSFKATCEDGQMACEALKEVQTRCSDLEGAIYDLEIKLKDIQQAKLKKSLEQARTLLSDLEICNKNLEKEKSKLDSWKQDVTLLNEVPCGDSFPTCKFLLSTFEKKNKIDDQAKLINNLIIDAEAMKEVLTQYNVEDLEFQISYYESLIKKLKLAKSNLDQHRLKVENSSLKVCSLFEKALRLDSERLKSEKYSESLSFNKVLERDIEDIEKSIKALEANNDEFNRKMLSITKEIGSKEAVVNHLAKEIEEMKDLRIICDAHEHYSDAMGKYGIAYQILVEKLPLINDEINKILSSVANFNVFIEHDADENSIRLYLQYGNYIGRRLELAGGAEKLLASIAIRTALLSITNLPKTNMFIIDEGFGSLDSINLDNINRMFDYLRSVFDHVLIISHIDIMKDMVDNNIEISIDEEGYSHVEVL